MDDDRHQRPDIRTDLAFWQAADRRSITTGPAWMWHGPLNGPLRPGDLPPPVADKLRRRRAAGDTSELFDAKGPRSHRLPRWASIHRLVQALVLALGAGGVAAICAQSSSDRIGIASTAALVAGCAAAAAAIIAAALMWAHRDPLSLTAAERAATHAARRSLTWNPLSGAGRITAGGAIALGAVAVCEKLAAHPAWSLPIMSTLRWQLTVDEEVFQVASAAQRLDDMRRPVQAAESDPANVEYQELHAALYGRLDALYDCLAALDQLGARAARASATDLDAADAQAYSAIAESQLATHALNVLNEDLRARSHGFDMMPPLSP